MLLATTAIIFPDASFTVPCNTSSGITRHRLPLVQFEEGRLTPCAETIGLTNGSLRPRAPKTLAAGFGFSVTGPVWLTFGAAVFSGALTAGVSAFFTDTVGAFFDGAAFFAGCTAITVGGFAVSAFFVSAFLVSAFLVSVFFVFAVLASTLAGTTGTGVGLPWGICAAALLTGMELVFTAGLPATLEEGLLCVAVPVLPGDVCAPLALAVTLGVPAWTLTAGMTDEPDFAALPALWTFTTGVGFAALVAPALFFTAGVGVGEGLGLTVPLAPEFCADAMAAIAVISAKICSSFISVPFTRRLSRLGWRRRRFFRLMAEECCGRTACQYGFTRSVGIRTFYLGRSAALRIRHLHIADVDDSLQLRHPLEEIHDRIIGTVNINGEWNFAVKLTVAHRHGRVTPDLNARSGSRVMQQLDELVCVFVFGNNPLLDLQLLLQDGHVAVHLSQLWLKGLQRRVLRLLVRELGLEFLVRLVQGIEIDVIVGHAHHCGGHKQNTRPCC